MWAQSPPFESGLRFSIRSSSVASTPSSSGGDDSVESLRQRVRALEEANSALREKLDAIAEVIGAANADKIVHDVRNVVNEVVLLRKLVELDG